MCRNIRPLYNFEPPATEEEIHTASLQFVKKVTGFSKPSKINTEPFNNAVEDINKIIKILFSHLQTKAKPRNRKVEMDKARKRFQKRLDSMREN